MRLEQLQYFISVAKTRSINKTSLEFFTTHQGVSKAIRQLEDEMGAPLFTRSPKGMELTQEGQLLLPEAEECVRRLHSVQLEISHRNRRQDMEGLLRIWGTSLTNSVILPPLIDDFTHLFPKVRYQIKASEPLTIMRHISTHRDAIGFIVLLHDRTLHNIYTPYLQQIELYPLQQDEYVCLVSSQSPLADRKQISFKEFCSYPVASILPESDEDHPIKYLLRHLGNTELAFASQSPSLLAQIISSGEYVCLTSRRGRTEADYFNFDKGETTLIPFEEDLSLDLMLATNSRPAFDEISQAFVDLVRDQAKNNG